MLGHTSTSPPRATSSFVLHLLQLPRSFTAPQGLEDGNLLQSDGAQGGGDS